MAALSAQAALADRHKQLRINRIMGTTERFRDAVANAGRAMSVGNDSELAVVLTLAAMPDPAATADRLIEIGEQIREVGCSIRDELAKAAKAAAR
jgi:hypothetical protein